MNERLKKALLVSTVMASGLLASCSSMHQMPDNAATMPIAAAPASKILLDCVDEKVFTLETPPELRTLTPEQRVGRVEVLKQNIEGFSPAQTAKIAGALERLFSIDQEHIRALADNIPDGIKIKNALEYKFINEVSGVAFYIQNNNTMYMFPGLVDKQHPIEIAARVAHELNHGKQSVQGILNPLPTYVGADKYISVKMAVEADSKVMHHNVFHTLAEQEKHRTGQTVKWSDAGEQVAQNIYDAFYKQSLNQVKAKNSRMEAVKLQDEASIMTGGKYISYLLNGNDPNWSYPYLTYHAQNIMSGKSAHIPFAVQSHDKVIDYIFSQLAQKHRISKNVFLNTEKNILKNNYKSFAKNMESYEYQYSYQDAFKIYIENKSKLETKTFSSSGGLLKHFKRAADKGAVEKQGNIYVYRSVNGGR